MSEDTTSDPARSSPFLEYGIIKCILRSLPNIQQLNKAARVCKSWNEVARIIKKNRRQIYQASNSDSYVDHVSVAKVLDTIKSEPSLCVAFLCHDDLGEVPPPLPELDLGKTHSRNRRGRFTEYHLLHFLRQNLPESCPIVGGLASGVIMSSGPQLATTEVQEGDAYSLLLIPAHPGVTVKHFYLDRQKMRKLNVAITSQNDDLCSQLLNLDATEQAHCLLLFGTDFSKESKCIEALCRHLQERKNPDIAISGGFAEAVIHPDVIDGDREYGLMGLVFEGADLWVCSAVIPPDITSVADIESIFLKMKRQFVEGGRSTKKSIAFMFACVARGVHVHGSSNVESSIFRRHFPSTPLLGFFGNGEIGVTAFPVTSASSVSDSQSQPVAAKKSRIDYVHAYSTAIALLSFPE